VSTSEVPVTDTLSYAFNTGAVIIELAQELAQELSQELSQGVVSGVGAGAGSVKA
jgi:hypothetical protein